MVGGRLLVRRLFGSPLLVRRLLIRRLLVGRLLLRRLLGGRLGPLLLGRHAGLARNARLARVLGWDSGLARVLGRHAGLARVRGWDSGLARVLGRSALPTLGIRLSAPTLGRLLLRRAGLAVPELDGGLPAASVTGTATTAVP